MNIEKIIFFEIITLLSKCLLVRTLPIFVDALAQNIVWISKPKNLGPQYKLNQILSNQWAARRLKMQKLTAQSGGGGGKKWKSRPLYLTQPQVYGKVKWMATSERVNLFFLIFCISEPEVLKQESKKHNECFFENTSISILEQTFYNLPFMNYSENRSRGTESEKWTFRLVR